MFFLFCTVAQEPRGLEAIVEISALGKDCESHQTEAMVCLLFDVSQDIQPLLGKFAEHSASCFVLPLRPHPQSRGRYEAWTQR